MTMPENREPDVILTNVEVTNCGRNGISIGAGRSVSISNSAIVGNRGDGISVDVGARLIGDRLVLEKNGRDGVHVKTVYQQLAIPDGVDPAVVRQALEAVLDCRERGIDPTQETLQPSKLPQILEGTANATSIMANILALGVPAIKMYLGLPPF